MKHIENFPLKIVRQVANHYNKSFHAKIFTLFASSESELSTFAAHSPVHYRHCFAFMKDDFGQWYLDNVDILRVRGWVLNKANHHIRHVTKLYAEWLKQWKLYLAATQKLLRINFGTLSDIQFESEFKAFYKLYLSVGSVAYIADCFMSNGQNDWLVELLKRDLKKERIKEKANQIIGLLTTSTSPTYSYKEELDLLKIACLPKSKQAAALNRHELEYYWLNNNYYNVEYLDWRYFSKKLKDIIQQAHVEHTNIQQYIKFKQNEIIETELRRQKLLSSLKLSNKAHNIIAIAELFAKWKDLRKSGVYIGMHHFDQFLKEIAKRTKSSKTDLNYLVFDEILQFWRKKINFKREIRERKKQTFFAVMPNKYFIVSGKSANKYFACLNSKNGPKIYIIHGVSACGGEATGYVRIIRKTGEMKKFKVGQILVTNQTTPEFVPIMKKAAAIITEQGGITSHAAIISRELGIPCVIGAKTATKSFKNGDKLYVNATKGIITILN